MISCSYRYCSFSKQSSVLFSSCGMWPELDLLILLRIFFNPFGLVAIGSTALSRPTLLTSLSRTSPPLRSPLLPSRTLPDLRNRPTTPLVTGVSCDRLRYIYGLNGHIFTEQHFTPFFCASLMQAQQAQVFSMLSSVMANVTGH